MKILSRPKKNAEEYGRWAVNPYVGCCHGCLYCYLKKGPFGKYLGQHHPVLKKGVVNEEHAYHLAMTEIIEHKDEIIRDGGLFFTFTSDPCIPETRELCFRIAASAIEHGVPVTTLTKNAAFYQFETLEKMIKEGPKMGLTDEEWKPIIKEGMLFMTYFGDLRTGIAHQRVAFGWTLTGHDELEPNANSNAYRLQTMRRMSQDGFKTWASIEPVIDFDSSFRMIQQALDAGCRHFKIGLMTRGTKVCRSGFTLGGKTFEPYDPARCLAFVQDVMQQTRDRATVYWKQSFHDFIGGTGKHRLFSDDELHKIFDDYPNAVGKDWSMSNHQNR